MLGFDFVLPSGFRAEKKGTATRRVSPREFTGGLSRVMTPTPSGRTLMVAGIARFRSMRSTGFGPELETSKWLAKGGDMAIR